MKQIDITDIGIIAFFVGYFAYSLTDMYYANKMQKNAYKVPEPSIALPFTNYTWNQVRNYPYATSKKSDLEKKVTQQ